MAEILTAHQRLPLDVEILRVIVECWADDRDTWANLLRAYAIKDLSEREKPLIKELKKWRARRVRLGLDLQAADPESEEAEAIVKEMRDLNQNIHNHRQSLMKNSYIADRLEKIARGIQYGDHNDKLARALKQFEL